MSKPTQTLYICRRYYHICSYLCPSCLKQFHLIIESEICEARDLLGPADGGHQLPVVEVGQERYGPEVLEEVAGAGRLEAGQEPVRLTPSKRHQQLVVLQRHALLSRDTAQVRGG